MKRWLALPLMAAMMAVFPIAATANEGNGQNAGGDGQHDSQHFGPFLSSSTDSGTCGDWAQDTFQRRFAVEENANGTFAVNETFKGTFVTLAGQSPGACEASSPHGSTVSAGVDGRFAGFLRGTVSGGTYNPNGCSSAAACNTTSGFVTAVFGTGAAFTCLTGVGACSFSFRYHAKDHILFREWTNASNDLGGNRGDIATA